jgi:hypothetical protein
MTKTERRAIALFIVANPTLTYPTIANLKHLSYGTITRIAAEFSIRRPVGVKTENIIAATPTTLPPEVV